MDNHHNSMWEQYANYCKDAKLDPPEADSPDETNFGYELEE